MPWSWTPTRCAEPELMDAPGLPEAEVAEAYRVLQQVNRQLGNLHSIRRELRVFLEEDRSAGGGCRSSMSGRARATFPWPSATSWRGGTSKGWSWRSIATLRRSHWPIARHWRLSGAMRSGCRSPTGRSIWSRRSSSLITSRGTACTGSSQRWPALRRRVVVLDIRRHWLAYWGIVAWSRLATCNRLVRVDGPLSVLRGFTGAELAEVARPLLNFAWTVRATIGFQLALVGRRITSPPSPRSEGLLEP